ncbi:Spore germination protein B3 [Paenibacillus allorhizoplanae]|uniref:Spore germination protein B3 n=1 Tax=Paenibacillus allorhizoplanae TaxID=2905648 RepID=A0ABM9CB23_9BACL|nr:Ger(x)C family spore germination protein [Paenibacillus allorhizoplanae]CAH1209192.1 Spore germination protein B3 [Paenibacillus allorhizoplanae]
MKICRKVSLLILSLCLLSGCWDRTELNDLALISALALDKSEDNQIQVTAQILVPQSQSSAGMMGVGGGGGGGATKHTIIRSAKGLNIADALSKLQRVVPRKLFWGQCKIFIFSDTLARAGIHEHFDFMVRHPNPREHAYLLVSDGKAADALELFPPIERTSAEVVRKLAELQIGIKVTMEQLSMMLKGDSQSASIPLVKILPLSKSSAPFQTIPYIMGTAVFKKDKMVGEISEKVTRGVMWIINEIKDYTITFKIDEEDGLVSLNPVIASVKLLPKIEGDTWSMTVKVRTEGTIVQNSSRVNPMDPDVVNALDKAFENIVKERIQLALHEVQGRLQVDIFNFAKEFHRKYPNEWGKAKDNWDEIFPKVEVKTDVKAHIHRPGLVNAPGGMPKDGVKEN